MIEWFKFAPVSSPSPSRPMAKIVDEHGQEWIVSEHREIDPVVVSGGLRAVDDRSYATLSFRTPDGRHTRILRRVAPLNWRYQTDDVLCLWLRVALPADRPQRLQTLPRSARAV